MDITLAKTFLTIVEMGNFREASERLNVTQSTISARVKSLEDQLGKVLFIRNKSGASLTQAGIHFQEYALSFVQLWERALNKVSSESMFEGYICIGARPGLWEPIVMKWLPWAKSEYPNIAYRVEFGIATELIRKLEEGIIDIAILLSAPSIPGVIVEELYQERFLLVTNPNTHQGPIELDEYFEKNFVEVDWGKEFKENKNHFFPNLSVPHLSVNVGIYGINYILEYGGCGYFPYTMVSDYLELGNLKVIEKAPIIKQPAYLAYSKDELRKFIEPMLVGFRSIADQL